VGLGRRTNSNINDLKALKQELAELLEEDAKANKLRSLPLYSCRITG
jgi:Leucine-rich repeat (LRR) protein